MILSEAEAIIKNALDEQCSAFSSEEISLTGRITYQNEFGEDCEPCDRKMSFITGELTLKHSELTADESVTFSLILCSKRGKVRDDEVRGELESFKDEVAHFRDELSKSQCPSEFICALSSMQNEQNEQLMQEFNEEMAKIDKNVKLMTYSTVAILAVGLIVLLIFSLLK